MNAPLNMLAHPFLRELGAHRRLYLSKVGGAGWNHLENLEHMVARWTLDRFRESARRDGEYHLVDLRRQASLVEEAELTAIGGQQIQIDIWFTPRERLLPTTTSTPVGTTTTTTG